MTITTLAILFCTGFLAAFLAGWLLYRAFIWNYVDIVYYPLVAVGVALLFISNDIHRDLFEVTQAHNQQRETYQELQRNKPNIEVLDAAGLLSEGIKFVSLVRQWVDICDGGPSSAEAHCLAVAKLGTHVDSFLAVAHGSYKSYEERLLNTCNAGDKLLLSISESGAISSLVADRMLDSYSKAVSSNIYPLDYDRISSYIKTFGEETAQYARKIHRLAFKKDDESGQRLLSIELAEIEYGEMIFRGLAQCITAPREELGVLNSWKMQSSTQAKEIARLERQREALSAKSTNHPDIRWMQLNLWPFVLIFALSLKFAKGSAALRKARQD